MRIFFSVGEPSGDLHGANLIRELRRREPAVECVGYGGPRMESAGCQLHTDLTQYAVMWFFRVLIQLHRFYGLYRRADRFLATERPDAVVLIDYPGFNWWIARAAKRHGIPVFYYGVPQMWAWAGWRIKKMRRLVDHVLCKLPFEADWYQARGCRATYVGHPYFDETTRHQLDEEFLRQQRPAGRGPLVTILPGSRTQEVQANLPDFLSAVRQIRSRVPHARFAIAAFNEKQAAWARTAVARSGQAVEVHVGKTPELIHVATCCLACSGSVSLELLHHEKPTVILYRVSRLAFEVQKFFRKVKFITLVNLLATRDPVPGRYVPHDPDEVGAEETPMPEYLTACDRSSSLARWIIDWLTVPGMLTMKIDQLRRLKRQYAAPGASARAADYLCTQLQPQDALPSATESLDKSQEVQPAPSQREQSDPPRRKIA